MICFYNCSLHEADGGDLKKSCTSSAKPQNVKDQWPLNTGHVLGELPNKPLINTRIYKIPVQMVSLLFYQSNASFCDALEKIVLTHVLLCSRNTQLLLLHEKSRTFYQIILIFIFNWYDGLIYKQAI